MLDVLDLDVRIKASVILSGVSFSIPEKSFAALVGRNGAGKTTVLRSVMGLVPPSNGSILFLGEDLAGKTGFARARRGIGYMPEDRRLIPSWTVSENLMFPLWACGIAQPAQGLDSVYALIPELFDHRHRKAQQLSGGQQKLVALGRSLLVGTRLLILDEPFEGVAPALAERLVELLLTLRRSGDRSVLVTESEFIHTPGVADLVYEIDRGFVRKSCADLT